MVGCAILTPFQFNRPAGGSTGELVRLFEGWSSEPGPPRSRLCFAPVRLDVQLSPQNRRGQVPLPGILDCGDLIETTPMNRLTRRSLFIVLAITATLLTGTVGFTLIEEWPPFDAFYMTLTTMTTVGYGEIHELSRAGRVFNSFLIFFGVTTIFIAIGAM